VPDATNVGIQAVINAIRADASGNPVTIRLGTSEVTAGRLDIGTESAQFVNDGASVWGEIALGKVGEYGGITSAITTSTSGTVVIGAGVSVTLRAHAIHNTSTAANGTAIRNSGTLTVNVSFSSSTTIPISGITGISNAAGGTVTISGGDTTIEGKAGGYGISNDASSGTVTINGGTVRNNTEYGGGAVNNWGTLTISGGTLSCNATAQYASGALYNRGGTATITGGTITSAIISGTTPIETGTVCVRGGTVNINGGTIRNTSTNATARAVLWRDDGILNITAGTITASAATNVALERTSAGTISLGGNATAGSITITGYIRPAAGQTVTALRGTNQFNPGTKQYTISYAATPSNTTVVVVDGYYYTTAIGESTDSFLMASGRLYRTSPSMNLLYSNN